MNPPNQTEVPEEPQGEPAGAILGDFRIVREIGRGGMGIVYEAEQISLKRRVALKVLFSHLGFSDEAVIQFRREAEAGGRQRHPGIVSIYTVGEHEGRHYIAQELIEEGRTLADALEEHRKSGDVPSGYFREVAKRVAEVAAALDHAHASGVIHRDVKPSNILLTREGGPKVTDFGLAKIEDALSKSRTGVLAGTPFYMSPEQASTRRMGIDLRTDIYSLGVTLYEMLTLERPFKGRTSHEVLKKILVAEPRDPRSLNPRVPRDLAVICLKAMEKRRETRYASMTDFAGDLNRFLSGEVILARPAGPLAKFQKRAGRNPALSAMVGAALVTLILLFLYVLWSYPRILKEQKRAVHATTEANANARTAVELSEEILRLSDILLLDDLLAKEKTLWPACPEQVKELGNWLKDVAKLRERLPEHERTLTKWRAEGREDKVADRGADQDDRQWRVERLAELVEELGDLGDSNTGVIKRIEDRLAFAREVHDKTITQYQQEWERTIQAIASMDECLQYGELRITPQVGLIPIGQDPESGLFEFAHLQTGIPPRRGAAGRLLLREESGLVFVLIPGGIFSMGAVQPTVDNPEGMPNVDPQALDREGPVREVKVDAFFLSKYEMTCGQWMWFTETLPNRYPPRVDDGIWTRTYLDPVEGVSWEEGTRVLHQLGLRLPSEAEWEYGARAGTSTVWWTGNDRSSLSGAANLADRTCKKGYFNAEWIYEEWLHDGYVHQAPVGTFRPNPFGLHNTIGNVSELCQDAWNWDYRGAPVDGSAWEQDYYSRRVARGGSWQTGAWRVACRISIQPDIGTTGLRPAKSIQ